MILAITAMPGIPELILVLIVIFITFGLGRLPQLGKAIGKLRRKNMKEIKTEEPIDLGKEPSDDQPTYSEDKPGTKKQPIEDAEIENDAT